MTSTARALRLAVYAALAASALGTLVYGQRLWEAVRNHELPSWVALLAPILFTVFIVVYAVDRWHLVRNRGYSLTRALAQIAMSLVFLSFLWTGQVRALRDARSSHATVKTPVTLLQHKDPAVRSMACELLGLRRESSAMSIVMEAGVSDPHPTVRETCQDALIRINDTQAKGP